MILGFSYQARAPGSNCTPPEDVEQSSHPSRFPVQGMSCPNSLSLSISSFFVFSWSLSHYSGSLYHLPPSLFLYFSTFISTSLFLFVYFTKTFNQTKHYILCIFYSLFLYTYYWHNNFINSSVSSNVSNYLFQSSKKNILILVICILKS